MRAARAFLGLTLLLLASGCVDPDQESDATRRVEFTDSLTVSSQGGGTNCGGFGGARATTGFVNAEWSPAADEMDQLELVVQSADGIIGRDSGTSPLSVSLGPLTGREGSIKWIVQLTQPRVVPITPATPEVEQRVAIVATIRIPELDGAPSQHSTQACSRVE